MWFRVASHLGRTVPEAQASLSSTDFLKWCWFLGWKETEEFNRQDYYLAQISSDISRIFASKPQRITIESQMLKFTDQQAPQTSEHRIQNSKNYWMGICGAKAS